MIHESMHAYFYSLGIILTACAPDVVVRNLLPLIEDENNQ